MFGDGTEEVCLKNTLGPERTFEREDQPLTQQTQKNGQSPQQKLAHIQRIPKRPFSYVRSIAITAIDTDTAAPE